jgi:acyl carrier protein
VSDVVEAEIGPLVREYIVSSWLSGDDRGLDDATDLQDVGVLDSFAMLSLVAFLEERFSIKLDPGDVHPGTFRNIGCIAKLVVVKRSTEGGKASG